MYTTHNLPHRAQVMGNKSYLTVAPFGRRLHSLSFFRPFNLPCLTFTICGLRITTFRAVGFQNIIMYNLRKYLVFYMHVSRTTKNQKGALQRLKMINRDHTTLSGQNALELGQEARTEVTPRCGVLHVCSHISEIEYIFTAVAQQ